MINKIDFTAKNLTSNAGLFLLLENAKSNEIFDLVEDDLVFDNDSTNKIKMNHIKTMICGHFIGIDKLERLKLLQNDPLVNEFDISVKEPETVSRFLGNFTFKTTQMFRDINFKVFKKLLTKSKLTSITIDIDSSVINVEGHQEGASKGYNPKKLGNRCYNIQFAFCDELKAYVTGFVRSGNTYTANGASEMIKEIVANIKTDDLEILFRMDSGYFDEKLGNEIAQMDGLSNIELYPLRSLLTSKLAKMRQQRIKGVLEVLRPVSRDQAMDADDLLRAVGILLDNAIEAAAKRDGLVRVVLLQEENQLYLAIANNYDVAPDMAALARKGYTTKGSGHGTGLSSYRRIVARCRGCAMRTYLKDGMFVQELHIPTI